MRFFGNFLCAQKVTPAERPQDAPKSSPIFRRIRKRGFRVFAPEPVFGYFLQGQKVTRPKGRIPHSFLLSKEEKSGKGPPPPSHLTISPPGDIVFPLNATTEKNPRSGSQRGVRLVKAPCDGGGRYHSGAARDDRDGFLPLQRHERPDGMMSRFACSQRAASLRLGLVFGPFGPPLALAPVHPRGSRRLSASGKQGGTVGRRVDHADHLTPDFFRGDFLLLTPHYKEE